MKIMETLMNSRVIQTTLLAFGLSLILSAYAVATEVPDFVELARRNKPSVVNISAAKTVTQ